MTLLFACIFVPDFSVEAAVRAEPEIRALRQKPVAVLDGSPPLQTVMGLNDRARALGVELGMTKLQAEVCPAMVLRKRSVAQEGAAHAAMLDCANAFSPRAESTASDTVIVDVAGLEHLFGPAAKIARELARHVADVGMEANVAIASNPDCAMHAARGFAGVTVIPPRKEAERLGELPVDVLRPPVHLLETLDRWGVRNLRGLAALPPLAVSERLGQSGLRLQRLARGEEQRTLVPAAEHFRFEESIELEDAVELLEPLSFLLNRLIEQVCARLNARALATNELRLTLELEGHEDVQLHGSTKRIANERPLHERVLKLPVPMQNAKTFLKLLQLDLQQVPPGAPVKRVTLAAEPVRPKVAQEGLFAVASPEPERLELTLARLRNVVGDATGARVGSPQLLDTHRPDAFRMVHFMPPPRGEGAPLMHCAAMPLLAARRIFRPAIPAQVRLREGIPSAVIFREKNAQVVTASGPWRTCGDWWRVEAWSRDEWELTLECDQQVALYRVFRDVKTNHWFVDASYD